MFLRDPTTPQTCRYVGIVILYRLLWRLGRDSSSTPVSGTQRHSFLMHSDRPSFSFVQVSWKSEYNFYVIRYDTVDSS